MKNKISNCLLGFGSLLVFGGLVIGALVISACSNNNANASPEPKAVVVVKDKFNTANLDKIEYIAETRNSYIGRYVDCKAGMTIYTHGNDIAVMPNSQINQNLIKEKCK